MPRVLLVEDDPGTTNILTPQLATRGVCHVTHAATVAEAPSMLDPPPDRVTLDTDLPDGTGQDVLEAIRKWDAVVFSTGSLGCWRLLRWAIAGDHLPCR